MQLKTAITTLVICLTSCSAPKATTTHTDTPIDTRDYIPPTDLELDVLDTRKNAVPAVQIDPEQMQRQSVERIEGIFRKEQLQLEACKSVQSPKECEELRKRFCEFDTYLDFRGYRHRKPYCP